MSETKAEVRARCLRIEQILLENWIGPHRSPMCCSNELKNWQPSEVEDLFKLLPDFKDRKFSPHGPESLYPPKGRQYWKEFAVKAAMIGAFDVFALVISPILLTSKTFRKNFLSEVTELNYSTIGSSLFIKCPLHLLRQVADAGMAVCVNKHGCFSVRRSKYAAISHVWAETMGLELEDQKIEHDSRGINRAHFRRIFSKAAASSKHGWFWLDLLAVPQIHGDEQDIDMLRELKTNVVNSLIHVYRNADSVVILDALTLQLDSVDPCKVAAILNCGRWLTRMWTYQEIKLAKKAYIVTKTGTLDFHDMIRALDARAGENEVHYKRWHEMYLKFNRLLPSDPRGVSLADVAFCCSDRNAENDIDYARSLYALLDLQWQTGWQYDDAILHIIKSRPQDAARIANLQGRRGLPPPYSWSPRYLARLTGKIFGDYIATEHGLLGYWSTFRLNRIIRHGLHNKNDAKVIFHLELLNRFGKPFEMWSELPNYRDDKLIEWWSQATPSGTARLLCANVPENLDTNRDPVVMLMVLQGDAESFGAVAGTLTMNDDDVNELDGELLQWLLA